MAYTFIILVLSFLLWKVFWNKPNSKQFEDYYVTTITEEFVKVEHPREKTQKILWKEVNEIKLISTDEGPLLPDVWLTLVATENHNI